MEAKAVKRYIPSSPRKMRLVVDLIRNKSVEEGINILKFSKKHPAKVVEKTLISAYSNLIRKLDTGRLDRNEVFVKEAFVNGGPVMKRMLPAPQGRAFRIRKRSAHLTLIVENIETKIK
jgi:large subunit ribosomal protein L22